MSLPSPLNWRVTACVLTAAGLLVAVAVFWRPADSPEEIALGRQLFEHQWQPGDPLAGEGDGLGPVFNARSCRECHFQAGTGGGGPNDKNVQSFEVAPTAARPDMHGGVVHAQAVDPHRRESPADVSRIYPIVPGGARVVGGCTVTIADFDPVQYTQINTPALFGAGLIDEIHPSRLHVVGWTRTAAQISNELGGDFSTNGAGRLRMLPGRRVGKFGWKGQFATLEEFVATACAVEMGLTNPLRAQDAPQAFRPDEAAQPDMTRAQLDALVAFVRSIPRPQQILPDNPQQREQALRGEAMFAQIGCVDCHTRNLGAATDIYSDLRLHIVENDSTASYDIVSVEVTPPADHPQPREWKTPPLWGVADSAPYFHDGGSRTLKDAIERHDRQARKAKEQYKSLPVGDRQAVITFLETLRAPQPPTK